MPEPEDGDRWIQFADQPPKRKRAEAVCIACHSKKIKCDVQRRSEAGQAKCSHCNTSNRHCEVRASQRGRRRRGTDGGTRHETTGEANGLTTPVSIHPSTTQANPISQDQSSGTFPGHDQSTVNISQAVSFEPRQLQPAAEGSAVFTSPGSGIGTHRSHTDEVDTGFLGVYGPENQRDAEMQEFQAQLKPTPMSNDGSQLDSGLQSTFIETYYEYCYCFCPVLDRTTIESEMAQSPLLANAVALAASHVQPPLLSHEGPEKYYDKARRLFYDDCEADSFLTLKALSLFYWWSPRSPATLHRHTSWWWQSVIIRHAQQMGIHREPPRDNPLREQMNLSLRRRIWWTAFARERLTALCQSKPFIVDEDDCTIARPELEDFPSDPQSQRKGLIFIHWVRLCGILGRLAKNLSRSTTMEAPGLGSNTHMELAGWINTLPLELQLRLDPTTTNAFDRDVHQLHLPYLTAVVIANLRRSAQDLPQALPPAILAASCTARILRDILVRGNTRFLMAITCWYCGTAFIALLQGSRIPQFAKDAEEGLSILTSTIEQLQKMWPTANIIRQAFDRMRKDHTAEGAVNDLTSLPLIGRPSSAAAKTHDASHQQSNAINEPESDWMELFPFVSVSTNKIAECLLHNRQAGNVTRGMPSPANTFFYENVMNEYNDLLDPLLMDYQLDFSDLSSFHV